MKTVGIFKLSLYTVCKENASGKCEQRYQIMQPSLPFTQHKMLAHQYHVSCLCIRKYFIPCKISICILKSAGKCQKHTRDKSLRHLDSCIFRFCFFKKHFHHLTFFIVSYYNAFSGKCKNYLIKNILFRQKIVTVHRLPCEL